MMDQTATLDHGALLWPQEGSISPTLRASQLLADGTVDPTRLKPQDAGFGAANAAAALRTVQAQIRFQF